MTVEEIFNKITSHMKEGLTTHCAIARAFDFLELEGFARMHDYHYCEESHNYLLIQNYYARYYHKLLKPELINPQIIPENWYKYSSKDVDSNTKKNAIKDLMEMWIAWEQSTKALYQQMRQELCTIGEVAAALELERYILDVTEELADAEKQLLHIATINYDLIEITSWQKSLKKKYKHKLGW